MKKGILLFLSVRLCFGLTACAEQKATPSVSEQSSQQEQSNIQNSNEVLENLSANSQDQESSSGNTETPETGELKAKLTHRRTRI